MFSTAEENQSAVQVVFLAIGETSRSVGELVFEGIPAAPRGAPVIALQIFVDETGEAQAKAWDAKTLDRSPAVSLSLRVRQVP